MTDYSKITALYSRLSVGDEDRDGGESNSIQNQKIFLENYARGQHLTNIRHYIDDDESGRFFDRSAYSRMMDDVENGKIGVCIMKDLTRWGRDYLQVGNAMEIFRRNNVRFIAVNNGIDSENPDTLEFAPFINIMSEWYAKDISKKVKTGIKTKGMSGKPIVTEAPYGYVKDPDNKDFWIIDEEAAAVVRLIFRLFIGGKNRNQIAVHLKNEQKFDDWLIPGRYLVFGDRDDLAELKAAELTPLTAVLKEHDAKIRKKQRAVTADDPAYIISGSAFRMLVGDLHDLFVRAFVTERHLTEAETEKDFRRIQTRVSGYERWAKRLCRSWRLPKGGSEPWGQDTLEACLREKLLRPYVLEETADDGIGCGRCCDLCENHSCEDDYD